MDKAREDVEGLFRQAMRRFPAAVTVVTTSVEGADSGMTATAVTSLSMDPPSLLVCVNRAAAFHDAISRSAVFCVNLLRQGQEPISAAFGGGLPPERRFEQGVWRHHDGIPYLADAQANIFCRREAIFAYGSHSIVVGAAIHLFLQERVAPLLYVDGRYGAVAPASEG
jgi:flavin reductase (DIM6/NTAB) family NADH-FMN oxidoreductase RutF